ncbi:recombinase family protein, partial [Aliarcobacter butzleri]
TLVVWKLDRLGRSVKSLIELVSELNSKNIHFKSLTDSIDTSTPSGRFFFHVMASLAQMERELIVERTKAGLESAKRLGRIGGRKRTMTDSGYLGTFGKNATKKFKDSLSFISQVPF